VYSRDHLLAINTQLNFLQSKTEMYLASDYGYASQVVQI